jgi:hypothetical protein
MRARVLTPCLVLVYLVSILIGFTFWPGDPETVRAAGPNVTGTYFADDGSVYFLQQNGTELWWAGFSLDPGQPSDEVFHRGVAFTNIFKGTILSDNTVFGNWAEVPRGASLRSGTLTLQISPAPTQIASGYQLKVLAETGGLTAKQLLPSAVLSEGADIDSRFLQVEKSDDPHSLYENGLHPYRDETVFYGRVLDVSINGGVTEEAPSLDDTDGERSYSNFICDFTTITQTGHDHDLNMNAAVTPGDMYFTTLGWGGNHSEDVTAKLWDATAAAAAGLQAGEGYIHAEAVMYGHTAKCGSSNTGRTLFPGWADKGGNSILLNGQPVDAYEHPENLQPFFETVVSPIVGPYLVPAGLSINGVSLKPGSQIRITGVLILDCGHGVSRSCYIGKKYSDDNNSQVQEIHPIYSLDVINPPLGDWAGKARNNLTGVWGDHQNGGTQYLRQIGNSIWMLSLTRTRASLEQGSTSQIPNDAEVFFGTITDNADGSATITGGQTSFQYGASSNGWGPVNLAMAVDSDRKVINTNFHGVMLEKLYEPTDTTAPVSTLTVSTITVGPGPGESALVAIGGQTQTAKQVTIHATDQGTGVQNVWYRYYTTETPPLPAYTFVAGPDAAFRLPNPSAKYRVDFYATDNAGNDESPKFAYVDLPWKLPPVATHPVVKH